KRLNIKVTMGPAFTLPQKAKGKDREALLQEYTNEVMCRIAALMPEEMRGEYAGHPRLKEIMTKRR
ncbi:MAG: hypothetical protein Q8M58_12815, partial [Anaerolineales bacterium]|nr:hypothetical protein [Anaerolineales bacterium]